MPDAVNDLAQALILLPQVVYLRFAVFKIHLVHRPENKKEPVAFDRFSFCEDKTIEIFLRRRCLDLNTRHNHSTSLRFCFQGCLQRHFDFRAADKDHLDFLF